MQQNIVLESSVSMANLSRDIAWTKQAVEERLSDKLRITEELIRVQTDLVGIYTKQITIGQRLRLKYEHNSILANALLNLPYRGLSILLLIRNTFYGSARLVCRQFFESLMIAKYGEYDETLVRKWELKDDARAVRDKSTEISLGRDVFAGLRRNGKRIASLTHTWSDLCSATHATAFSQQYLRLPNADDNQDRNRWHVQTHFFENTEYTLDLLMTLLAMNFHLVMASYGRKANRWYFGYLRDPYGSYERERELKENCKALLREYFALSKLHPGAIKMWKSNISEFRQKWGSG